MPLVETKSTRGFLFVCHSTYEALFFMIIFGLRKTVTLSAITVEEGAPCHLPKSVRP